MTSRPRRPEQDYLYAIFRKPEGGDPLSFPDHLTEGMPERDVWTFETVEEADEEGRDYIAKLNVDPKKSNWFARMMKKPGDDAP